MCYSLRHRRSRASHRLTFDEFKDFHNLAKDDAMGRKQKRGPRAGSPELDPAQSAALRELEERARKHAADAERTRHVRAVA